MEVNESSESRNQARQAIFELANLTSVPMSLNAVARLNVADAIWQSGSNTPLSASEILSRILPTGGDAENLQRILRLLTSYGVFTEHIGPGDKRKYSLTDIGKTLVSDDKGISYGPYVIQHHQDALVRAWPLLHEAVKESTVEPFVRVNGEPPYDYYMKNPEMNVVMIKAMAGVSIPFMKAMLEGYDGFKGVDRLVDVGGSCGDSLKMILQKNPSVREAINFDLPEVIAKAPIIPGVTHVGGNMFKFIPEGDAIFMKWMLVVWTDEECKKILENCYKATPNGGKVIVVEPVMPEESDESHRTRILLQSDIFVMGMYRSKGKIRTEEEYKQLGRSVGFHGFCTFPFDFYFTLFEFHK